MVVRRACRRARLAWLTATFTTSCPAHGFGCGCPHAVCAATLVSAAAAEPAAAALPPQAVWEAVLTLALAAAAGAAGAAAAAPAAPAGTCAVAGSEGLAGTTLSCPSSTRRIRARRRHGGVAVCLVRVTTAPGSLALRAAAKAALCGAPKRAGAREG